MERPLIHRAVVHRQAMQFALRIADESPAILNVILRSLSDLIWLIFFIPIAMCGILCAELLFGEKKQLCNKVNYASM